MTFAKMRIAVAAALALFAAACATTLQFAPFSVQAGQAARFEGAQFVSYDGTALPAEHWRLPDGQQPWAIVLALHGINSSAKAFDPLASWLAARGVETYAYDVRGFGRTRERGAWVGMDVMKADARSAFLALRQRHPDTIIAVLGGSLGAAQAIMAFSGHDAPLPDRLILVAPGVMGWDFLPFGYAPLLRAAAITAPWVTLQPSPEMERTSPATNNPAARAYQAKDPLRIRQTRVDVLAGSVDLMDAASRNVAKLRAPTAFLYGAKDFVIDQRALKDTAARLPRDAKIAVYPEGHHLLLRDLYAQTVYGDVLSFLRDPAMALPSTQPQAGASDAVAAQR